MTEAITEDVVVTRGVMPPAEWGIYALCYMQVCAYGETPIERVEQRANELNPPGTSHPWEVVRGDEHHDPDGGGPDPRNLAPIKCEQDPARLHYMLRC